MRSPWRWWCLIPLLSCQHAQTTDASRSVNGESPHAPDAGPTKTQRAGAQPTLGAENGRIEQPGHPILSVSAQGLRKPGGTERLKEALHHAGVLPDQAAATEADVRQATIRFQAAHDLAQTGFADHETLRQLGLDPNDIDLSQMPRTPPDGGALDAGG